MTPSPEPRHCNPLFPEDPSMCFGDQETCECLKEDEMPEPRKEAMSQVRRDEIERCLAGPIHTEDIYVTRACLRDAWREVDRLTAELAGIRKMWAADVQGVKEFAEHIYAKCEAERDQAMAEAAALREIARECLAKLKQRPGQDHMGRVLTAVMALRRIEALDGATASATLAELQGLREEVAGLRFLAAVIDGNKELAVKYMSDFERLRERVSELETCRGKP